MGCNNYSDQNKQKQIVFHETVCAKDEWMGPQLTSVTKTLCVIHTKEVGSLLYKCQFIKDT